MGLTVGRRHKNTLHKWMSELETLTQHSKEGLRARVVCIGGWGRFLEYGFGMQGLA